MAIKDWPEAERPREKLLRHGPSALSDAELLAIFLRTGCVGRSAVDVARDLLRQFRDLRSLLEADRKTFCKGRGLGDAKYIQLQAILEMSRRHLSEALQKNTLLTCAEEVKHYLTSRLRHRQQEVFAVLFLDGRHRLLAYEELFFGTINAAHVHPREVVKRALHHNAAALILAHNHPSGVAEPSQADKDITSELSAALLMVDIRILDHMVVGEGEVVSFAESGLMPIQGAVPA